MKPTALKQNNLNNQLRIPTSPISFNNLQHQLIRINLIGARDVQYELQSGIFQLTYLLHGAESFLRS
jgi:hypothetical protein